MDKYKIDCTLIVKNIFFNVIHQLMSRYKCLSHSICGQSKENVLYHDLCFVHTCAKNVHKEILLGN